MSEETDSTPAAEEYTSILAENENDDDTAEDNREQEQTERTE